MRQEIKYMKGLLAVAVAGLMAVSCIKDKNQTAGPDAQPEEKVTLDLYVMPEDYSLPTTRANENLFDNAPMVLLFKGHGSGATFSEVARATASGSGSKVVLTATDQPVTLLLITNVPQDKFFNGTAEIDFTEENIATTLAGATLADIDRYGFLQTVRLSSNILTTLPFFGTGDALPMSVVLELASLKGDQTIGPPDNSLKLQRAMAKVTVEVDPFMNSVFELMAVGVVNAPRSGSFYYDASSPKANDGNLTRYGTGTAGMAQAVENNLGVFTTADDPIYLYESRADQGTALIIKARFYGVEMYYKMPFYDWDYLDIIRNKHYTFRIIGAGNGYEKMEDAIKGETLPDFGAEVTVTDTNSYDIISNEKIYIGVTCSTIDTFVQDTHTATFLVFTDAGDDPDHFTSIIADDGISLATTTINLATTPSNPGTTFVNITIDKELKQGRIALRIGALTKIIEVIRHSDELKNGISMELPYDDYVWAQRQSQTWLYLSTDGTTPLTSVTRDAPTKLYLMNTGTASSLQVGEVQAVRRSTGRSSIYVNQPMN